MAGRRLGSYRKGDWNEELGILLLKSLAAVQVIQLYAESEDKVLAEKLSSLVNHLREFLTTPESIGESGNIQWNDPMPSLR